MEISRPGVNQATASMHAEATHVFNVQAQNIHNCKDNLKQNQHDLELVKDSITTVEVYTLSGSKFVISI